MVDQVGSQGEEQPFFLHGYIQGGLAMTEPCVDHFINTSEEESLLRLIVVEVHFDLLK